MAIAPMPTPAALAERAGADELARQASQVGAQATLTATLNQLAELVAILNGQRQIVYVNNSLVTFLGLRGRAEATGQRPGEVLRCQHAIESRGGCGTTRACAQCGALRAVLNAQRGARDTQECRIVRDRAEALDLRLWAMPIDIGGVAFTLVVALDISHEKRRQALERLFFHDLLNTAGGLVGLARELRGASPAEVREFSAIIASLADQLVDEIEAQRELTNAERGDLLVSAVAVHARRLVTEIVDGLRRHQAARERRLVLAHDFTDCGLVTDATLLRRVVLNMITNAVEAAQPGDAVTVGCRRVDGQVEFSVHNPQVMPEAVQVQVFQRSFSTKGAGRGLGAYGMKLVTERYLQGTVSFTSAPEAGTTFRARIPLLLSA